eukprot:TRINITY_DN23240_c0_g1_i1.p1 TRINITY_DN23240_c0_g1~~TRINITY_DN23240_c0_g1_i1.p1  ORF type:complete len:235 (-),score=36.40 TRINITY_DN23240_c0_g1_i1:36-740(-)
MDPGWLHLITQVKGEPDERASYLSNLIERLLELGVLKFLFFRSSTIKSLVGVSITALLTISTYYMVRQNPIDELENEIQSTQIENAQLKIRMRTLKKEITEFRKANSNFLEDNKALIERAHGLEHRSLDLLESITLNEVLSNNQLQLIKQIYKEEIVALTKENETLTEKLRTLQDSLQCLICCDSESNCIIKPCGHSICSSCIKQILNQPGKAGSGTPCPFCRTEIVEVLSKNY